MNRAPESIRRSVLAAASVLALIVATGSLKLCAAEISASQPNFVIFIADDLSWHDVACFGGPTYAKTPHLDQLASEGMKLTAFYSPAAVCSPVRQSLLTGMYPVRSGAYPNHAIVNAGAKSLPHYLKPLGYRTVGVGKKHFARPQNYPFDQWFPMLGEPNAGGGEDSGNGDLDLKGLEQFLDANKQSPFFAYIAPNEPHGPWSKGDRSAYDPADLNNLAPYLVDTPEMRDGLARYYAEVSLLDQSVGAVLQTLKKTGRETNTLFIFVSEQGSSVPQGKWSLYNPGIRVAAIAAWPGKIKPGSSNDAMVQYVDILPTLIAAAGGDPVKADTGCPDATGDRGFDGRSFLDVLLGKTNRLRDAVFAQHTTRGIANGSDAYASRAVFDGRWKLIVNIHHETEFRNGISNGALIKSWRNKGQQGDAFAAAQAARYTKRPQFELYDLQTDPWELTNVADHPDNATTLTRLRAQLAAWMKQQGDEGHETEMKAFDHQVNGRRKIERRAPLSAPAAGIPAIQGPFGATGK